MVHVVITDSSTVEVGTTEGGTLQVVGPANFHAESVVAGELTYYQGTVVSSNGNIGRTAKYSQGFIDLLPFGVCLVFLVGVLIAKHRF